MRKSCIQIRRQSRLSSLDRSNGSTNDVSFDGFVKSQLGERITLRTLGRVAT